MEYQDTHQAMEPLGAHPMGYLSYGADCRMYAILVAEGRRRPAGDVPTDAEKIELFDGMGSYAGTYTVEGDRVVHHVDISWNEVWTGTTQVRLFAMNGNILRLTACIPDPVGGVERHYTLEWQKVVSPR